MLGLRREAEELAGVLAQVLVGPQPHRRTRLQRGDGGLVHVDLIPDALDLDDRERFGLMRDGACEGDDHTAIIPFGWRYARPRRRTSLRWTLPHLQSRLP